MSQCTRPANGRPQKASDQGDAIATLVHCQRVPSFQGSALERPAFEASARVSHAFATQEAGASVALRPQAEPGDEC